DLARLISPYAFEDRSQGQFASFAVYAGFHRSAADEYSRDVHAKRAHHHPWRDLVTVRDADHSVEPVGGNNGFQGVGNDFPARQGITHPDVPHRNTIIDTDGVEFKRYAASFADRFFDDFTEFLQMHMARN